MNCMDQSFCETESPEKDLKNLDENNVHQNKAEDEKIEQKSPQESGHYWWCPAFGHLPNCHYLNFGFQDPNYWQSMSVPYQMPYIQMPKTSGHPLSGPSSNTSSNRTKTVVNQTAKKSPKIASNGMEIERLYSCRLCDQLKETKDVTILRKHIEDHLGITRPFLCEVCGKQFKFRSNCRNHIIAHSVVRKNYRRLSAPFPPI